MSDLQQRLARTLVKAAGSWFLALVATAAGFVLLPSFGVAGDFQCAPGTLASYEALGTSGCTIGSSFVFSEFNFSSTVTNELPPSAGDILVYPYSGSELVILPGGYENRLFSVVGLSFSVNLSAYPLGTGCYFPYQGQCLLQSVLADLSYDVSALGESFLGADFSAMGFIGSDASGGAGAIVPGCYLNLDPFSDVPSPREASCTFGPTSSVEWDSGFTIHSADDDGGGAMYWFSSTLFVTPEPPAWLLLATVLLIMGKVLIRRRRTSQSGS